MSNVGGGEIEAKENSGSFVVAMLTAEAASASAWPTMGILSPRKCVQKENDDEARPFAYLDELD